MPRIAWIPQYSAIEKSYYTNLLEDNREKLPLVPSMVGGSLLFSAEEAYEKYYTSISAMTGQRFVDSIDESFINVNVSGASKEQQNKLKARLTSILRESKARADQAMYQKPILSRVRHLLFTTGEKQVMTQGEGMNSKRAGTLQIDDIMVHARLLSGSLGVDLSMLGFADQLSGGLGDGGFFRVSAQIAESSRATRCALTEFFNNLINLHILYKYGKKITGSLPYSINFYGSISAFESEKQRTKLDAINASGLMVQTMAQLKDLGLGEKELSLFLTKEMLLDQDEAEIYAKAILSHSNSNNEQDNY